MIVEFQAMKVLQMRACLYNIVTEVVHKIAKADYNQRNTGGPRLVRFLGLGRILDII